MTELRVHFKKKLELKKKVNKSDDNNEPREQKSLQKKFEQEKAKLREDTK